MRRVASGANRIVQPPPGVDRTIAELAAAQRGLVTRRQLISAGVGRGAIAKRLESARLHAVHRGVYLVGHVVQPALAGELAAVLACGPGATLRRRSAGALWSMVPPCTGDVEVSVPVRGRGHRPGILVHHDAALGRADRTVRFGVPVTTPARTLADLAAVLDARKLERALAEAYALRLVDEGRLRAALARHGRRRGGATLRTLLDREVGPRLTRSEAEERMLALVGRAQLPAPQTNASVGRYEVDFLWRAQGLALEVDGYTFHSSRRAFEHDRRRDAALAAAGLRLMRVTWRQIVDEGEAVVARLAGALAHSATGADAAGV